MKYAIVVSAILAAACGLPYDTTAPIDKELLMKELTDFANLMPYEKIVDIIIEYTLEDKEFQHLIQYTESEEFKLILGVLQTTPEVIEVLDFLDKAGLPVYVYVQHINDVLGISKTQRPANYEGIVITGGLNGLAEDMRAIVPFDAIEALHFEKLKTSAIYAEYFGRITSHEFIGLVRAVQRNDIFKSLLVSAETNGIDLVALKSVVCALSGIRKC